MSLGQARRTKAKPLLICFVGVDGSGKTTQAQRLVSWLEGQGMRSHYVWNIFQPRLLGPLMKAGRGLFLKGKDRFKNYPEYYHARRTVFRFPGLVPFFHYCFFAEYLLYFLPRVRLPLLGARHVVCDRYVYDAVVGLAADLGYSERKIKATIGGLLRWLPLPDMIFLLDLPEEVAIKRKDDVPSVDFLEHRRRVYLSLAREHGMLVLDGTRDPGELEALIQDEVRRRLLARGWALAPVEN